MTRALLLGQSHPLRKSARAAAIYTGRCDDGLAVTLVESYFRPRWRRYLEYAWLLLPGALKRKVRSDPTVGMSQVRASALSRETRSDNVLARLRQIVSAGESIDLAAAAAATHLSSCPRGQSISRFYTGLHNPFYDALVESVRCELQNTARLCRSMSENTTRSSVASDLTRGAAATAAAGQ